MDVTTGMQLNRWYGHCGVVAQRPTHNREVVSHTTVFKTSRLPVARSPRVACARFYQKRNEHYFEKGYASGLLSERSNTQYLSEQDPDLST